MIFFEDIVQVLHRSVPATATQDPFLLYIRDGCAIDRRQIRIDDTRLRMGSITQRFAKQLFGCIGIAQRRKQEINGSTGRIDGPTQVAPALQRLAVISEYRKYQRTAQRIRTGSVCRHLKIAGRVGILGSFRLPVLHSSTCNTSRDILRIPQTLSRRPTTPQRMRTSTANGVTSSAAARHHFVLTLLGIVKAYSLLLLVPMR